MNNKVEKEKKKRTKNGLEVSRSFPKLMGSFAKPVSAKTRNIRWEGYVPITTSCAVERKNKRCKWVELKKVQVVCAC